MEYADLKLEQSLTHSIYLERDNERFLINILSKPALERVLFDINDPISPGNRSIDPEFYKWSNGEKIWQIFYPERGSWIIEYVDQSFDNVISRYQDGINEITFGLMIAIGSNKRDVNLNTPTN